MKAGLLLKVWWWIIATATVADAIMLGLPEMKSEDKPLVALFGLTKAIWLYFSFDRVFGRQQS